MPNLRLAGDSDLTGVSCIVSLMPKRDLCVGTTCSCSNFCFHRPFLPRRFPGFPLVLSLLVLDVRYQELGVLFHSVLSRALYNVMLLVWRH